MKPVDARLLAPGTRPTRVTEWRDGRGRVRADWLAEEVPVALVFNGVSHAVMLASPADLEDFALGFALTEGLIDGRGDLYGVEVCAVDQGIELQLEVSAACAWRLKERRRTLAGRTGCGLCGPQPGAGAPQAAARAAGTRRAAAAGAAELRAPDGAAAHRRHARRHGRAGRRGAAGARGHRPPTARWTS